MPGCIDLSWTPVHGATEYRIEVSNDGVEFHDSAEFDASATFAATAELGPGERYYYRVTAVGPGGDLAVSNLADATTLPEPGGAAPPRGGGAGP